MRVVIVSREFPAADERIQDRLLDMQLQISDAVEEATSSLAFAFVGRSSNDRKRRIRENKRKAASERGFQPEFVELIHGDRLTCPDAPLVAGRILVGPGVAREPGWPTASGLIPHELPPDALIHLVDQHRARTHLQRQGGGIIEDGVYLLHPKRPGVLVPLRTYHHDLLQEMQREARVVLGCLGAKRLVIETIEGVTFGGEVVSRIPFKSGGASVEASEQSHRRVTYEWGSPTYEPDNALDGCAMLQDNSGIMTLVEQRQTSDLTRYEEYSKIDTSFGVSIDVMGAVSAGFKWAQTSTYRYEVEFFPRKGLFERLVKPTAGK